MAAQLELQELGYFVGSSAAAQLAEPATVPRNGRRAMT